MIVVKACEYNKNPKLYIFNEWRNECMVGELALNKVVIHWWLGGTFWVVMSLS